MYRHRTLFIKNHTNENCCMYDSSLEEKLRTCQCVMHADAKCQQRDATEHAKRDGDDDDCCRNYMPHDPTSRCLCVHCRSQSPIHQRCR